MGQRLAPPQWRLASNRAIGQSVTSSIPDKIANLQKAIGAMHSCGSRHVESVPVREVFRGETAWQGTVKVFDLYRAGRGETLLCMELP